VLYTEKYSEFCKIVSDGHNDFIEFLPPKSIWLSQKMEILGKSFDFNKKIIFSLSSLPEKELNDLFDFQSAYLKNTINFYLEEGGSSIEKLVQIYDEHYDNVNDTFNKKNF